MMKAHLHTTLFIFSILLLCTGKINAQANKISSADNGIILHLSQPQAGVQSIRIQIISDDIIRVTSSAGDVFSTEKSIIINPSSLQQKGEWTHSETDSNISVQTKRITATINKQTGAVVFRDKQGSIILQEKERNGKSLKPAVFDGEPFYHIQQSFTTTPDDAIYGLGQHQDGKVNYRNQQVWLFQNNTEVAVPFLVSNKRYGILWDNASLTKAGDVRDYLPLDKLKLFSAGGDEGWLTASYFNDATDTRKADFQKAESHIAYEFLGDTKLYLPKEFNISKGAIRWEGSIAAEITGVYKFRFTYAGYFKVWIDGKQVADGWRQPWNPNTDVLNLPFEKGKKYSLKIEWIPDGGESYLSAKWLPPVTDENEYSFSSDAGKQLDYYFVYGSNMDSVIAGYRMLTGKATIIPKWALGFWQSRERYKTEEEILTTSKTFREKRIPIDNIVEDWSYWKQNQWGSQEFDPARFPSPDSMIKVLHNSNLHFMISVWPKFYEGIEAYQQFDKNNWLYKRNIANRQRDWIAEGYVSTFYDAFNPAARKGFWNLLNKKLYNKGIDAWWMDASEPDILSNVSSQERIEEMTPTAIGPAAAYLNAYPMMNAKGIFEGQRSVDPNKRVFLLTRSAFAGSQQYGATIWSGDIASRWEDMKDQIAAGINFSMSGLPYWTMDIGGFATEARYSNATGKDLDEWRELNTRWYQFGAFCPIFRVHGQYPFREIYNIAPDTHPAYQSMLYYNKLRYRLLPYLYSIAGWSYHKDYTLMRGLAMDFTDDAQAANSNDQYMFGPSFLINPVYTYGATKRRLYLPSGSGWYDLYTGKYNNGGQTIDADAPYGRMPLYIKAGSIIPAGPELQYTSEKPADHIALFIYTGNDASFDLYEDDGLTYSYEKGAFSTIPIRYSEQTKTLTIGKREGSFSGMITNRKFSVVWISKGKSVAFDADKKAAVTLSYNGQEMSIKMK